MDIFDELVREYEREIQTTLECLAPLEAGTMHLGSRIGGGPWIDITQDEIKRLKEDIADYESAIKTIRQSKAQNNA